MLPLATIDQSHQATKELAAHDDAYMDSHWNLPQYFGHIKVISLDTKAERFQRFTKEMEKVGMNPGDYEVVQGVKGESLDTSICSRMVNWDKHLAGEDLKKRHQGQAGCFMAHFTAIKGTVDDYKKAQKELEELKSNPTASSEEQGQAVAKVKRLSSVLIIEDNNGFGRVTSSDSATLEGIGRQFRLAMKDLDKNWDMFYFMSMWGAKKITNNLAKLEYGIVTKCYAINACMYDRVIEALEVITTPGKELKPVDHAIASLHKTSNCYVSTPPLTYRFGSKSLVGGDLGKQEATPRHWQSHVEIK